MKPPLVVAIDGPAASGKSTLGRLLAAAEGLSFLDTGLLYRAVARGLIDAGADADDTEAAVGVARLLNVDALDAATLAGEQIGAVASRVAVVAAVREALLDVQRGFARRPPGAVLAGRDIGSVVCPDADLKVFVTATAEARARRRAEELRSRGEAPIEAAVLTELRERDRRDSHRPIAPLVVASDARVLDTSALDIDAALGVLRGWLAEVRAARDPRAT